MSSLTTLSKEGGGYAISKERAREIVDSAILTNFSPDYVNPGPAGSLTSSGYIRFAVDTHTVNATAIPVTGISSSGKKLSGYAFDVTSVGTMPISGGIRTKAVYRSVVNQARLSGEFIKVDQPATH